MSDVEAAEEFESFLGWLRDHGVRFELSEDLQRHPDHDPERVPVGEAIHPWQLEDGRTLFEHRDPERRLRADHATDSVLKVMDSPHFLREGEMVWELGCGTGVLAVAAALHGARVIGSDLDDEALELAEASARDSEVSIDWRHGSLYEPFGDEERASLIVANLPHKPVPLDSPLGIAESGGPEGNSLFEELMDGLFDRLEPDGRLLFFLHSLPTPRLLKRVGDDCSLRLHALKRRYFGRGEYAQAMESFLDRHRDGRSYIESEGERRWLVAGVWSACRP